jgi:hypothetical protein
MERVVGAGPHLRDKEGKPVCSPAPGPSRPGHSPEGGELNRALGLDGLKMERA